VIDPETVRTALLLLFLGVIAPLDLGIAAMMRAASEAGTEREN
jgi:hypothetical protein